MLPYIRIKIMISTEERRCPCCIGRGTLKQYEHIAEGRCFNCQGAGYTFTSSTEI